VRLGEGAGARMKFSSLDDIDAAPCVKAKAGKSGPLCAQANEAINHPGPLKHA